MASGMTLALRRFTAATRVRDVTPLPHPTPGRDRSLRGKARRKARRARQS